jgi:hypothetical protein
MMLGNLVTRQLAPGEEVVISRDPVILLSVTVCESVGLEPAIVALKGLDDSIYMLLPVAISGSVTVNPQTALGSGLVVASLTGGAYAMLSIA